MLIKSASPTKARIRYRTLREFFFYGTRNVLTQENLKNASVISSKLIEPCPYGTYLNEQHFLDTLEFFLKTTTETRHRGIFFLREILPRIRNKNHLLDIGPGDGLLTKWIGSGFNKITIVDKNSKAIERFNLYENFIRKKVILHKINESILDIKLPHNQYDLCVLSHVLYYIDKKHWIEVTKRVYDAVNPGGYVVIVLNGDGLGKFDLIKRFNGKFIEIDDFITNCVKTFIFSDIEIFKSIEIIKTTDLLGMKHVAGFFLCDVGATATSHELEVYLNEYYRKSNGQYEITMPQKFIVIQKPITK